MTQVIQTTDVQLFNILRSQFTEEQASSTVSLIEEKVKTEIKMEVKHWNSCLATKEDLLNVVKELRKEMQYNYNKTMWALGIAISFVMSVFYLLQTQNNEQLKIMQEQLHQTNQRIDQTNQRIDQTNQRMDQLSDKLEQRINQLSDKSDRQYEHLVSILMNFQFKK